MMRMREMKMRRWDGEVRRMNGDNEKLIHG